MDCGPACLGMIAKHYGRFYSLDNLRRISFLGRDGVSLLGISRAAEKIGFRTIGGRLTFDSLTEKAILPCIVHWNQNHFVVVYQIKKSLNGTFNIYVADPGKGLLKYSQEEFCRHWITTRTNSKEKGVALILEPTNVFYEIEGEDVPSKTRLTFLGKYLLKYKRFSDI